MHQLTYFSKTKSEVNFTVLNNILQSSNTNNAKLNITGCLIYHRNTFIQILEGDKKEVDKLYKYIKTDQRHEKVTLLWENSSERFFDDWSMAYYQPKSGSQKEFIENLILYSELTEKSSGSLLSFWATVKKTLSDGKKGTLEKTGY